MSSSRINIIYKQLLQSFEDESIKQKCRNSAEKLKNFGTAGRIFDNFPCLLPENMIQAYFQQLEKLFQQACPNNGILTKKCDIEILKQLLHDIANTACGELLAANGQITPELVTLLNWPNNLSQSQICAVISAFSSHINQELISRIGPAIVNQEQTFKAFCYYVDEHNSAILQNAMLAANKVSDRSELIKIDWSEFTVLLDNRVVKGALLAAGLGLFALAVTKAVSYFAENKEEKAVNSQSSNADTSTLSLSKSRKE